MTEDNQSKISVWGLLNLFVVYIVWSSTYLAIRLGMREGSGFEPFVFAGSRVLIASVILFGIALLRREKLSLYPSDFWRLLFGAIFLWITGNGMVVVASKKIDSGISAILVGSSPIWSAIFESFFQKRIPTPLVILSLLVGFFGTGLVLFPTIRGDVHWDFPSLVLIMIGTLSWSFAMNFQKKYPVSLSPTVSSAYQQLFAGIIFLGLSFAFGEKFPSPTLPALLSWGYLIVFGSVIAFTSFLIALHKLPMKIATTYAYVNPVFAVFLGWLFLNESVTIYTFFGAIVVIIAIAGIYYKKRGTST